jgi:hypothetical protein
MTELASTVITDPFLCPLKTDPLPVSVASLKRVISAPLVLDVYAEEKSNSPYVTRMASDWFVILVPDILTFVC